MAQLLAALRGEARDQVAHLAVTDENYETARKLLIRRYENRRRLIDSQLEKFMQIPVVTQVEAIRLELLNPVLSVTKALEKLGLPVCEWSYLLVYLILSRLPVDVQNRFEQSHGKSTEELPTLAELMEFVEAEACRAEKMCIVVPHPAEPQRTVKAPVCMGLPLRKYSINQQTSGTVTAATSTVSNENCPCCKKGSHAITQCDKFRELRVQARRQMTKQRGWCFACFGRYRARDCTHARTCEHCGGLHSELLCMNRAGQQHAQGRVQCDTFGALRVGTLQIRALRIRWPGHRAVFRMIREGALIGAL